MLVVEQDVEQASGLLWQVGDLPHCGQELYCEQ
jgi:hypothetical protein